MIGTSDGQKYDSSFEHTVASTPPPGGPEKAADALNQVPRYPGSLTNSDDLGAVKSPDTLPGMQEFPKGFVYPDRNDKVPGFPTPTLDRKVLKQDISLPQPLISVLSHPDIAEAIANPKIDRTHEVPYVAGASSKPNDFTTHVDKSVPSSVTISGKTFDPAIPLNIHEQVEKHVMEQLKSKGMTDEKAYEIAHHEFAEPAEDAWYKAQGIDVKDVNKWWAKIDKKTEQDKGDFPKDLYKAPYPHDKVEGVKHEPSGVSAEWAMGKQFADSGDKQWEEKNWNSTWENAQGYTNSQERNKQIQDAISQGKEWFDAPSESGRGLLFLRTPKDDPALVGSKDSNTKLAMNLPPGVRAANDNLPPHNPMRRMDEAQQYLERLYAEKKGMGKLLTIPPK